MLISYAEPTFTISPTFGSPTGGTQVGSLTHNVASRNGGLLYLHNQQECRWLLSTSFPRIMQVVLYLSEELAEITPNPYFIRCAFGDKMVPANSYFQDPDSITPTVAVLCEAPAGPAKNSVVMRLALDGRKYYIGPQFTYKTEKSAPLVKDVS
eukprot:scaffold224837_cov32-Prasinocladus_malaysianus.AAC.1